MIALNLTWESLATVSVAEEDGELSLMSLQQHSVKAGGWLVKYTAWCR